MGSGEDAGSGTRRNRAGRATLGLAIALAVLAVLTPQAGASKTRLLEETLPTPPFENAQTMAVDRSSGNLLVVDSQAKTLSRWKPNGEPAPFAALGTNVIDATGGADTTPQNGFEFLIAAAVQVAVDNSGTATDGDIYVTQGGKHLVDVFAADGSYLGQLTKFINENNIEKPLDKPYGVAVDAAGAVYLGERGKEAIIKYVSKGAPHNPLVTADTSASAFFNFESSSTLAAGAGASAGALFVDHFLGPLFKVSSATATGVLEYEVEGGVHKTVTVNPANGHLFALNDATAVNTVINEHDASGGSATLVSSTIPGLAEGIASTGASDRLYVSAGTKVDVYGPPVSLPDVVTAPASAIGGAGATLNGTVDPGGVPLTECKFEYGTTASYGLSAPCAESLGEIGSGNGPVAVHAVLSGLDAETEYHFRLTAKNANSEALPASKRQINGEDEHFKTLGKPTIEGAWAESVLLSEATLKAKINPEGLPSTYRFEWGLGDEPYEHSTGEIPLGEDAKGHLVSLALSGLSPGTAYHWRVVATNANELGGVASEDHLLTTYSPLVPQSCPNQAFRAGAGAALPDCRAYEMVSPLDKAASDIVSSTNGTGLPVARNQSFRAAGQTKLTYTSERRFGDAVSQPAFPQYIAARGAGGWSSHGISPPRGVIRAHGIAPAEGIESEFKAFSDDLCEGWLVNDDTTLGPLAPGGANGAYTNLYARTNCGAEGYRWLAASELAIAPQGISADGSVAIFRTLANLSQAAARPLGAKLKCETPLHGEAAQAEAIAYRWLSDGAPIGGATAPTFTATAAQEGEAIQCQITATNAGGGSTQLNGSAWVIAPYPATDPPGAPRQIAAPTADGALTVGGPGGQELSCDPNAAGWSGSPSFAYQWYRNGAALESGEEIANGSQSPTYTTGASDLASAAAFQCVVGGTNAGGTVARASANLSTDPGPGTAAPVVEVLGEGENSQMLYVASGAEEPVAVCVAPGGKTLETSCSAGSATGAAIGYEESVQGALAASGEQVYWSDLSGRIFRRENPAEPQSALDGGGECTEAGKACTSAVSAGPARFWKGAADGSGALFSEGGDLYRYEAGSGAASPIAGEVIGVVGASEDLERVYVVSEEALSGEENSEEAVAAAGEPNLYLYEAGAAQPFAFVATLAGADARPNSGVTKPSPLSVIPTGHAARVSPDGGAAAFASVGSLTGYDNTDVVSGEADTEVFRYEAASGQLSCVSCNPSGARPTGRHIGDGGKDYWAAGRLAVAQHALYFPRSLSDNGNRVFFESFDPLVIADTNGAADVYQWEAAGEGDCTKASGAYNPQAEGCISLISSGKNPEDSVFFDATPAGEDVFFSTAASLVSQDPGLIDVYDARVGGGIAPPGPPPPPCEGEACQSPPPPPAEVTPSSSAFEGPGNVAPGPGKSRCAKGKRRVMRHGKPRCVKKHKRHRAHHERRAAR